MKELAQCRWWNQSVEGKGVGFFLFFVIQPIALDKNFLAAMLDDVASLMEKGEPQMIVALAGKTQWNYGFVADPSCRPLSSREYVGGIEKSAENGAFVAYESETGARVVR